MSSFRLFVVSESIRTRFLRWQFNLFPAFRGTGGRVTYISRDMRELHVAVPLSFRTRNYVGTIFGGSMFGAVDPMYMVMFINLLGSDYLVWDKSACIRFRHPGRSTLHARFLIADEELDLIRRELETKPKLDREYRVELTDEDGVVCAEIDKVVHFQRRNQA